MNMIALASTQSIKRRWVGRPTKYSEQVLARLCDALADGMPISGACIVAGIAVSTLAQWRERHHELEQRIAESREVARQTALRAIKAAGEKDWRAHAEWLKLTFRDDYRSNGSKMELSNTEQKSCSIRISEEMLRRIQDRHLELMEERANECETGSGDY